MKFFTNKGVTQKIVITILIVILTTFAVPAQVQADWGGKLMSPVITLITALVDGVQHLLEMTMLGETESFMKGINSQNSYNRPSQGEHPASIQVDDEIDGSFFGLDAVQIPVITYTPEEIFSNKVPALDVNFITPSVKTGDEEVDQKRNVAIVLQPIISSWYKTLRIIATVGLLSVLLYLGIRMLLTSIAADRAKYKQMVMDWLVAMCLVFTLHYIMAFAMTMAETVTAMLSSETGNTITVTATNIDPHFGGEGTVTFNSNLMSYVRFMVQAEDAYVKIAFFALYIMLVIFSVRFTWVYLKRVVSMAFLTLIAPIVALTYPIDKVSDGKAQAFNMWLKEYSYNALIQPVDLLLYKVLLSSAMELAANNPLYAVVALAFIIAAEKLVKQMLGFNKASGGTVGSLAGAAGVSAFAGNMLSNIAKKPLNQGGNGKIRTKDVGERQGKDADANKPFSAMKGKDASQVLNGGTKPDETSKDKKDDKKRLSPEEEAKLTNKGNGGDEVPPPPEEETQTEGLTEEEQGRYEELDNLRNSIDDDNDPSWTNEKQAEWEELSRKKREAEMQNQESQEDEEKSDEEEEENSDKQPESKEEIPETWQSLREADLKKKEAEKARRSAERSKKFNAIKDSISTPEGRAELKRKAGVGAYKRIRGIKAAAPALAYKAARGTLSLASRAALGAGVGIMGGIIGATTGDGDKAMNMAMGAAAIGGALGDNLFEASPIGKVLPKPTKVSDAYGAGKYGNIQDARNAKADKEYVKSDKFNTFYDKEFKDQYSKDEFKKIVTSYRRVGITSESDIKKALKLEKYYKDNNKNNLSDKDIRDQVQNIVASYNELGSEYKRAFAGDEKAKKALMNDTMTMLGGDSEKNRKLADTIYQGYIDLRTRT